MTNEQYTAIMNAIVRLETRLEGYPDLLEDVEGLKEDRTKSQTTVKVLGWVATVLGAGVSWLGQHVLFPAVILGLFSTCALPADSLHWPADSRPVPVYLDAAMSEDCMTSAVEALSFMEFYGVEYLVPIEADRPRPRTLGTITFQQRDHLDDPSWAGVTYSRHSHLDPYMLRADVYIESEWCKDPMIAAHELGHALGLEHKPRTVMHWRADEDMKFLLDQQQQDQIQ